MRWALRFLILATLLAAGVIASTAFNYGTVSGRTIDLHVVTDANAYVGLAATAGGPHACFVYTSKGATSLVINDSCSTGYGAGLPAGDGSTAGRYAKMDLNDILTLTNQGDRTVGVWVNATTSSASSSAVQVQVATSTGQMTDSSYAATTSRTSLTVGSALYIGVQVNSGTLGSTANVTGTITIDARGST